jgi:thioredoxin
MAVDATPDTFRSLIAQGDVLLDFWGPCCQPCIALMPVVEAIETRYTGRMSLVKVSAPENRAVCRELRVLGLPTYILCRDGAEVERLTGEPTQAEIEAAVERLVAEGGGL